MSEEAGDEEPDQLARAFAALAGRPDPSQERAIDPVQHLQRATAKREVGPQPRRAARGSTEGALIAKAGGLIEGEVMGW